jgi:hypothetical protein
MCCKIATPCALAFPAQVLLVRRVVFQLLSNLPHLEEVARERQMDEEVARERQMDEEVAREMAVSGLEGVC